jgi:ParB-like chromosome segregation protein Spo0J
MSEPEVVETWHVELVPLATLNLHPRNYRDHDVGAIAESLKRWGPWRALVVQRSSNTILVGNGEAKAFDLLGVEKVPVRWVDVDDANALAILLADNWIPSRGRNMDPELLEVMQELREERELFSAAGADDDDLDALEREVADLDRPLKLDSRKMSPKKGLKITCPECGHKFETGAKK